MDLSLLARDHTLHLLEKLHCLKTLRTVTSHEDCGTTMDVLATHIKNLADLETRISEQFPQLVSFDLLPYWSSDVLGSSHRSIDENDKADLNLGLAGNIYFPRDQLKFQGAVVARSDLFFALYTNTQVCIIDKFTGTFLLRFNGGEVALHDNRAVVIERPDKMQVWNLAAEPPHILYTRQVGKCLEERGSSPRFLCFNGQQIMFKQDHLVFVFDDQLNTIAEYAIFEQPGVSIMKMGLCEHGTLWHLRHHVSKEAARDINDVEYALTLGPQPLLGKRVAEIRDGGNFKLWQGTAYKRQAYGQKWLPVKVEGEGGNAGTAAEASAASAALD